MEKISPLPYQVQVVDYLKLNEPEIWAWASSYSVKEQHVDDVRAQLLRETYRLDSTAYPEAYNFLNRAKERLGIVVPVTLYQASEGAMNAMLCYLPDEAHIVLTGPVLDSLDEHELVALFGHELAHFSLWSENDGDFHTADRILNHVCADPNVTNSQLETARLYSLFTEIFADRGGAYAAQSALPAISSLVKVQTGMRNVDAASYLKQAQEINASSSILSQGNSHPENYLRAEATHKWWSEDADVDDWVDLYFRGVLSLNSLDLIAQQYLMKLTRQFIATILTPELLGSERVLIQLKSYFPDWHTSEKELDITTLALEKIDTSVFEYLNYVMLDLVLADDDLHESALVEMTKVALVLGSTDKLLATLKKEVNFEKRKKDELVRIVNKVIKG